MGGDYFAALPRPRGTRPGRLLGGDHPGGRRSRSARCRSTGSAPTSSSSRWLPDLCAGERLAAFGLTEPGGGSDARRHAHHGPARRTGEWVINGSKSFITNSGTDITSLVTVMALTGARRATARKEISHDHRARPGRPASPSGRPYSKVGWHASDTHELSFDDCRVPEDNLLGERGRGYAQFLRDPRRGPGRDRGAGRRAGAGLRRRVRPVRRGSARRSAARSASNQAIQFTDRRHGGAGRTRPGWPGTTPRPGWWPASRSRRQAAIAKLTASNAAMDNARDATQVFGGYGFMNEYPVARFYRDAKVLEIGEGTSEVQRMLIARELGFG